MRETYDASILMSEGGDIIGVNLGSDHCAEHEWGIKGLKAAFGVTSDESVFGVERRKITTFPKHFRFVTVEYKPTDKRRKAIVFKGLFVSRYEDEQPRITWESKDKSLFTAWDQDSFCIVSRDPNEQALLLELYEELIKGNVVMWLGGAHVFKAAGLALAITHRIDPKYITEWERFDREEYEIKREVEASGIEKTLRDAGKHWYALKPCRQEDGSLSFFLNPSSFRAPCGVDYNFGWFSLEDLRAWARNEGPVMKNKSE